MAGVLSWLRSVALILLTAINAIALLYVLQELTVKVIGLNDRVYSVAYFGGLGLLVRSCRKPIFG